jgi:hypothetical protein
MKKAERSRNETCWQNDDLKSMSTVLRNAIGKAIASYDIAVQ